MESGHKSGGGGALPGGGAGGEGVLCHACGYQYPNAHPSAKQRRGHRKHCGKTPSAAAEEEGAGERDGKELLQGGGGGGGGGGGEGIGASAAECGGGLPGSAPEVGDAVEDGDNAEHSFGKGTGHQVVEDKSAEDCPISCHNIPSEITPEASRTDDADTLTAVATQHTEKGSPTEYGDPSDPAISSEELKDSPASVLPPVPEDGARFSSEISEYEIQNSSVDSLASNATGGEISEQTNDAASQLNGVAVTEEDGTIPIICENKPDEDKSVKGDEFVLSCQDNLQTKIGEGHSTTLLEEDSSDKNLIAVHNEESPKDETEFVMLTNPIEDFPNTEEPFESSTEKSVDDDLLKLGTGGCHSETPGIVEPQQQPYSTSVTADHLSIPEQAENVDTDGGIQAIPSAIGSAVGAKVVPVDAVASTTENVCSSDVTVGDSMQKNVTSDTVVPTQVDPVEVSTTTTVHEINIVGSTNDVDEKRQNEKTGSDLTSHEVNEMHIVEDLEEKHQNKEIIIDPISHETNEASVNEMHIVEDLEEKHQNKEIIIDPSSHETNEVSSTDNYGESEQNEEIIAEISAVRMSGIEVKEPIEEFIAKSASEKISETSSRDIVEEKKQKDEIDVKANREIYVACSIETVEENNATSCEINAGNATDNIEDNKQNEEITMGPISDGTIMICSTVTVGKTHNEDMTEHPSSHETIVAHTGNVEEKKYEDTTTDPTTHNFSVVTSSDNVEDRKDDETTADPTSSAINAERTADNVEEKWSVEPILDPTSSKTGTVGSIGDAEDEKQIEETTADPSSGENNTLQSTDNAENKKQNGDTTTDPASDETEAAQNTNDAEEREKTEDTATREINTIQSTDDPKGADQNEEIADKEMVMDSDRNHVSLKVLLADKNVETKEKKASTKERVLSFRRRASKDNVSPAKSGSPKAGSGQQDWNSPARLPAESKPKGRKQQWVPFICCSSIQ
ncbi:uncharacterized protein LOC133898976 isoform X1 [Phragmites australis]|uniref:uncharacterized protein LOC133898976 isoform X1 n=1 Tax=Phragmites australis TaxID=29695 RepID=UPI002D792DC7|nr:uncharacterized protein LOC133898976 isoform X1 [Phragmites australis]